MLLEISKIYSSNDLLPQMAHAADYVLPKSAAKKQSAQALAIYAKHLNCHASEVVLLDPKFNDRHEFIVDINFLFNVHLINALKRTGKVWFHSEEKFWRFTPQGESDNDLGEAIASCMKYVVYLDNSGAKLYENMDI